MEALRADGEGAAAGGADQEEPGGEAEEEVTNERYSDHFYSSTSSVAFL